MHTFMKQLALVLSMFPVKLQQLVDISVVRDIAEISL